MNEQEKYHKIMKALQRNKPVLPDKEKLTDDIMKRIQGSEKKTTLHEKLGNYLFGWADVSWIRSAMAAAAVLFIVIFITQQIIITNRINNLEKQLIRTVNTINRNEPDLGIMQKVLLNIVATDQMIGDSIKVSRSDLEELLNSYLELQEDYENLKQNDGLEPYLQKMIKRRLEGSTDNDESELKL
jgi:hypothetical protein